MPSGFNQLGSFDPNNLIKRLDGTLEPYIVARDLQGITLEDLLKKHQIHAKSIHFLKQEYHIFETGADF
jgi:hypothetical protein